MGKNNQIKEQFILITQREDFFNFEGKVKNIKLELFYENKIDFIQYYKAVIIDSYNFNEDEIITIIKKIRSSNNIFIYLLPVFIISNKLEHIENKIFLEEVVDGFLDESSITNFIENPSDILHKIRLKTNQLTENIVDNNIYLKILRYLYTRNKILKPVFNPKGIINYTYPVVSIFLSKEDKVLLNIVNFLENEGFISGTLIDKIHLCPNCYSSLINFREICPKCGSIDIYFEDIIHHFRCGYVGKETDFKQGISLVCPKCGKTLNSLGVDYDKPSIIYECNSCKAIFQEANVDAVCFNCGFKTEADNLILQNIKEYELTSLGESVAIYSFDISFSSLLKKELNILDLDTFKYFIETEIARKKRYKGTPSSLGILYIQNINDLYLKLGENTKKLAQEIAHDIKNSIRKSDVISLNNQSLFLFLFTETPKKGGNVIINRLKDKIYNLIKDNFKLNIEISTNIIEINKNSEISEIFERIKNYITT